jgi:hypothetical protein
VWIDPVQTRRQFFGDDRDAATDGANVRHPPDIPPRPSRDRHFTEFAKPRARARLSSDRRVW